MALPLQYRFSSFQLGRSSDWRSDGSRVLSEKFGGDAMRLAWTLVAVLLVLWLLGFSLHIAGGLIHLLLVVAFVLIVDLLVGRRSAA